MYIGISIYNSNIYSFVSPIMTQGPMMTDLKFCFGNSGEPWEYSQLGFKIPRWVGRFLLGKIIIIKTVYFLSKLIYIVNIDIIKELCNIKSGIYTQNWTPQLDSIRSHRMSSFYNLKRFYDFLSFFLRFLRNLPL